MNRLSPRAIAWLEIACIFLLFAAYAGVAPPAVNEAHYLAKARHHWDPAWCAGDAFLESRDAHVWFFALIGWAPGLLSMTATAWLGRGLCWLALAACWRRLSWDVAPRPGVAVLSAGWMLGLVDQTAMAGEWIVGGFESKCLAFPLVLLAICEAGRDRWERAWPLLGGAALAHVLVGGWAALALGFARCVKAAGDWSKGRLGLPPAAELLGLATAVVLAAAAVAPPLMINATADDATRRQASWIYVYQRLGHHLVFHRFQHARIAAHGAVWVTAFFLRHGLRRDASASGGENHGGRRTLDVLWAVSGFALGLVLVGVWLDQAFLTRPHVAAPWLRYYWFRLADVAAPWFVSLAAARWLATRMPRQRGRVATWWCVTALSVAAVAAPVHAWFVRNVAPATTIESPTAPTDRQQREEQWRATCRWIRERTHPNARFLTPLHQRSFKWFAERSEVVTWKDVPQDAESLVAWSETQRRAREAMRSPSLLVSAMDEFHAGYYVWDRGAYPKPGDGCVPLYSSDPARAWFVVYRVRSRVGR